MSKFLILFQAIPFRVLETFSSRDMVARYISDPQRQNIYLKDLYKYLIKRKYFTLVRQLMETKVPALYDEVLSPPNSISDTLLQMVRHPLKLLSQMPHTVNNELANLILSSFIEEILAPVYTPAIQLFLIPCLANSPDFPFIALLQRLNDVVNETYGGGNEAAIGTKGELTGSFATSSSASLSLDQRYLGSTIEMPIQATTNKPNLLESTYLFHALLKLDVNFIDKLRNYNQILCAYIRILAHLSNTIRTLPRSSKVNAYRITDDDDDDGDDSDSSTKDNRRTNEHTISRQEIDVLTEAIGLLNEHQRAVMIVDSSATFLNNPDVLHSLCLICHNLMLHHRLAIYEYK